MKKLLIHTIGLILGLATIATPLSAQGTLKVTAMPGYPQLPQDTAFQSQNYSFGIMVINNTNTTINSTLEIKFRVDSLETVAVSNPVSSLAPGDSITLNLTQYFFSSPFYKAGNNIVVVWPRVINGLSLPVDTFYAAVYFVPVSGTGVESVNTQWINIFPNPASEVIFFPPGLLTEVEYVRILTLEGRVVYHGNSGDNQSVFVGHLPRSIYIAEAVTRKKIFRSLFIRE